MGRKIPTESPQGGPQDGATASTMSVSPTEARKGLAAPVGAASVEREVRRFTARLKHHFGAEIERDPAAFKRRALHALRIHLPPGPGRPCLQPVTRAIEMRAQRKPWSEIYPACIPDFASLERASRRVAQWTLRNAARARRNATKRRKRRAQFSAPPNTGVNVSPSANPASGLTVGV